MDLIEVRRFYRLNFIEKLNYEYRILNVEFGNIENWIVQEYYNLDTIKYMYKM